MGKGTEGKEFLQTMWRGSHTPYPVGRRIASLIPPARLVASLALACARVDILGASWGLLGTSGGGLGGLLGASWGPPGGLLGASWGSVGASWGPLGASGAF